MKHDGVEHISEFVAALKLTPRQIQEVFRILGHIFETSKEKRGRIFWCLAVGSIVMAALKIGEPRVFHLLGKQEFDPRDAVTYLRSTLGDNEVDWWFTLLFSSGGLKIAEGEKTEEVFEKVGLSYATGDCSQWHSGWGHSSSSRFVEIYKKIEQISQWS